MALTPDTATAQKAAYILLTSAMYHVNRYDATTLLVEVRSRVAKDMDIETLVESITLTEVLVYPRFATL